MSQCFPSWDLEDDAHAPPRHSQRSSPAPLPMLEYQVAELTWENGQLAMHGHGLGPQRSNVKPASSTLEAIVNQATCKASFDAMVPCSQSEADQVGPGRCSEADRVPVAPEWEPSLSVSMSGSQRVTVDTYEELGFTSTSLGSADDHESVSVSLHSRLRGGNNNYKRKGACEIDHDEVEKSTKEIRCAKFSTSTKRSRAAAIHNQSERKRRDKINQRMKTLQKLVPNSNKTDKASMLDEVIDYLKQLQAQVQMMSRFNMMQQMAIMAPMGMAAMGMGFFDMAARTNPNPLPFIPITPAPVDRAMTDPLSAFLASNSHQPMTMDAYTRLQAAMYQQMQQNPSASSSKK